MELVQRIVCLEREVQALGDRVEAMRHVSRDISLYVSDDVAMINLVVDNLLAMRALEAPEESISEAWRRYANRIEFDDAEEGTLRPDICARWQPNDPKLTLFNTDAYLEACWAEHCEVLRMAAGTRVSSPDLTT